jgi:two-component system response regulator DesR
MDEERPSRRVRILLADDHPAVRRALRMWLELDEDFEVVGEVADGEAAVQATTALRPDVVVMDAEMPRLDGIAATAALRRGVPEARVIVQSIHADAATRERALAAGAVAFFGKGTGAAALLAAIRRIVP